VKLSGLHLLLTYQCTFECDHCFVWGSPSQTGTMTLRVVQEGIEQAVDLGSVEWIYFEGGEPFLYYPVLLEGVRRAAGRGFRVGIVSNAYWATSFEDAVEWLKPLAGLVEDLSVSNDLYHGSETLEQTTAAARAAAAAVRIPFGTISVAQPEAVNVTAALGQLPPGESAVMYRGRAAAKLATRAVPQPWAEFTACPHEDLREPGRVHLDPFGHVHICQGITLGNIFRTPLWEICETYVPDNHPIAGPLLRGGPAGLVREYRLPLERCYADACHLCDAARRALRGRYPEVLTPDQMYGKQTGPDAA
jgi:MoaA/NifB/PqqE/SkfB family radical SAM enzyme